MKLSFVIITYNSKNHIKRCLDSILSPVEYSFEVIVIDNNSIDSTVEFIKQKYPQVKLVTNTENKGSSFARNQGIKICNDPH